MDSLPYDDRRIVEGFGSVEVRDNAGEIIPISEIKKYMETYEKRGAPINYGHSNQQVGKMLDWEIVNVNGNPAVKLKAKLFNDYKEDDEIWHKVKEGIITGFSIGGGRPTKKIMDNGTYLYDVPVWEFSLVEKPCNRMSKITGVSVAKSDSPLLEIPLIRKGFVQKPEGVDEVKWEEAKKIVSEEYKEIPAESDKFYALVQGIYQTMIKEDTQSNVESKEVDKMVEEVNVQEPTAPEVSTPTVEERIAYLEKIVGELMNKINTPEVESTQKEEPPMEEDKKEEPKEEEPKVDYEEMKKSIIEEVKKALEVKKEDNVKKAEPAKDLPVKKSEAKEDDFASKYFK